MYVMYVCGIGFWTKYGYENGYVCIRIKYISLIL
jgi:hypothetical protein